MSNILKLLSLCLAGFFTITAASSSTSSDLLPPDALRRLSSFEAPSDAVALKTLRNTDTMEVITGLGNHNMAAFFGSFKNKTIAKLHAAIDRLQPQNDTPFFGASTVFSGNHMPSGKDKQSLKHSLASYITGLTLSSMPTDANLESIVKFYKEITSEIKMALGIYFGNITATSSDILDNSVDVRIVDLMGSGSGLLATRDANGLTLYLSNALDIR